MDYHREFDKACGTTTKEMEFRVAFSNEAKYLLQHTRPSTGRKFTVPEAEKRALALLINWYRDSDNYMVDMEDPESILDFVTTHRPGTVWAVMRSRVDRMGMGLQTPRQRLNLDND